MPCLIRVLLADGLHPVNYTANSLAEAARYETDDGVYTVTNTYNTFQVLKLDAHLDRLERSAEGANIPLKLDRPHLRKALRQMIEEAGFGSVRFRLTVPRENPESIVISIEPYIPPSDDLIHNGVNVITVPNSARHNPEVKSTDWMHNREMIQKSLRPSIYDALLLSEDGAILEGLASNFYAIINGELRTAGSGVLYGISRQIVFELAPPIIRINETAPHVEEIARMDEAFLTSSSRGIIPIVTIDGIVIGQGLPGHKTKLLRAEYQTWVAAHLEEL